MSSPPRKSKPAAAIVMCGPSGVGKGTLIKALLEKQGEHFAFSVSHTSRAPRPGEVDGINYHYSSAEEMREMEARGEFLELCDVHGNLYGTSLSALDAVRASGKTPLIEIDYKGAQKVKAQNAGDKWGRFVYVFVAPPSVETLRSRIVGRDGADEKKLLVRLATAQSEMDFLNRSMEFFDDVIVNDDFDDAFSQFTGLLRDNGCLPVVA
jgi:guanylate kinase